MCPAAACRVCLAVDVRLLPIAGSLQLAFERITSTALHSSDGRPVAACYICYAQLKKCRKLMLTSAKAENVLNDLLERHSKITVESVSQVDRQANGLGGSLSASKPEKFSNPLLVPVVIKTELEYDVAVTMIKIEQAEGSPQPADVSDIQEMACDSDEGDPISVPQPSISEVFIKQDAEVRKDIGSAQTSLVDKQKQVKESKPHGEQGQTSARPAQGPHQCCLCQRRFTKRSNLFRHMKVHTGEKPYECDVCKRRFKEKCGLKHHLKTHTGEKPYQCDVCHHGFIRKPNLINHIRTHTGEKPFECNVCQRRFTLRQNLHNHSRVHTGEKPFVCTVCKRQFAQRSHLKCHSVIHSGEKPFKCDVCNRRFAQYSSLKCHAKTHTGEKPYKCNLCPRTFAYINSLKPHLKSHASK